MKRLFAMIICASAMIACSSSSKPVESAANDQPEATATESAETAADATESEGVAYFSPQFAAKLHPVNVPEGTEVSFVGIPATDKKIETKEEYGAFDFQYPAFGLAEIDKTIEQYAKDAMEKSKEELSSRYEDDKNSLSREELDGFHHTMEYEIVRSDAENGVDVLFIHEGYTGGAHGFFFVEPLMIDKSGKILTLSDIYDDVPAALQRLSEESRRILPQAVDNAEEFEDMIKDGTSPEPENYSAILRTSKGVRVYFNPYSVAPWSAGILAIDFDN
ncbi:MAG: DUF3298 domain-containing protein [Proteobacteria bacterium]|nr:DUF3298 domain-containing protein [Pseudomonadota bacterium]